MSGIDDAVDRRADRAVALLTRPGARLTEGAGGYAVRLIADRRRRPALALDEAAFRRLVRSPGLRPVPEGGWTLASGAPSQPSPAPGRPGVIAGERSVSEDGVPVSKRANLGESPIAWLARRKDADGRPWLSLVEAAAGEKLRADFVRAGMVGRMTMDWSGTPGSGSARGAGLDPAERALAAKTRIALALAHVGPGLSEMLVLVCQRGSALEAAERDLGLTNRSGKVLLKLALQRLAKHYGVA